MNTQKESRKFYAKQILAAIADQPQSKDTVTQAYITEVAEALALGCSLQKPRRFGKRIMSSEDFIKIADNITIEKIGVAVNSLLKNKDKISNRVWYILGVLSRY